jgi:hypothetical protein
MKTFDSLVDGRGTRDNNVSPTNIDKRNVFLFPSEKKEADVW